MPKSNKEKNRLEQIRLFEKGEIPFDTSMIKLKLVVAEIKGNVYIRNIKNIKHTIIYPEFKKEAKIFILDIIKTYLSHIKIYEFKIKINVLLLDDFSRNVYSQICLFSDKKLLCEIVSDKNLTQIYKLNGKILIEDILYSLLDKFKHGYQNVVAIRNDFIKTSRIKTTIFNNKKFKDCDFYQDIVFSLNYIKKNNSILQIKSYEIVYDFINKLFITFFVKDMHREVFIGHHLAPPKTNLEVCAILSKIGHIKFDVENMSEEEIFEMYDLLNY